jgi:D-lyxose ketol-isomerase
MKLLLFCMVHIYGEGQPTPGADDDIADTDKQLWIAKTKKKLLPGQVGRLEGAETMHWMQAGDEGAIVSEFSTFHDGNALKFSNPNAKL